jgi:hypothetical protein
MHRCVTALVVAAVLAPGIVRAQGLPTEPLSVADGRLVVGAEVTATVAADDPGFFNYTDYEYSALRNFRVSVAAEMRASQKFQVLGEIRIDHGNVFEPFALYARIRPWAGRRLDIQVGRIPPTFGLYGRGTYGTANLLIGTPLAYQYLTSLRPDALPLVNDDLIRMRGRGWLSNFPVGNPAPDRGLPLVNSFRWDTGIQVHGVNGMLEWTGAVTTGSLSNPRVDDDNDGKEVAGRGRGAAAAAVGDRRIVRARRVSVEQPRERAARGTVGHRRRAAGHRARRRVLTRAIPRTKRGDLVALVPAPHLGEQ